MGRMIAFFLLLGVSLVPTSVSPSGPSSLTAGGAPGFRGSISAVLARGYKPRASGEAKARPSTRCWVVIDFDAVFCSTCFDPFLDLCRALPASIQEDRVLGVVVFSSPKGEAASSRRGIVERKWEGVREANGIRFPVVFDDGPIFRHWLGDRQTKILGFDWQTRTVREFDLPLRGQRFDELLSLLLN